MICGCTVPSASAESKLKGYWSITVKTNWRIIFRFRDGNSFDVELIDYH